MPKAKRGRAGKGEKEKPLLTVQGVLRLEKSFITAKNADAQTIKVRKNADAELEDLRLVPGQSEHEMVSYKAGYAVGPANPNPENETEAELIEAQSKVAKVQEKFEEMAEKSAKEREEREEEFKRKGFVIEPKTVLLEKKKMEEEEKAKPKPWDKTDPTNYLLPEHMANDPALGDDLALEQPQRDEEEEEEETQRGRKMTYGPGPVLPPGDEDAALQEEMASSSKRPVEETMMVQISEAPAPQGEENSNSCDMSLLQGEESMIVPNDALPQMRPMPSAEEAPRMAVDMALEVAQEVETQRKRRARKKLMESEEKGEEVDDEVIYSLDELQAMEESGQLSGPSAALAGEVMQGPKLPDADEQDAMLKQQHDLNHKQVLDSYWQFVRENPQDFNGWCYLVQHVETMDDLDEVRVVYNAFLPLYPYCYAYWQRYSEIERKHEHWQRALAILHRGLEAIPLSVDLWIGYLDLYHKMYCEHANFGDLFRIQCERAIQTVGLDYRSDALWERYLEWETESKNLRWVTEVYRRLVSIPTKLYNKHWDNFIAHIRDHHPRDILEYEAYEELRRVTCQELELTYRPDPILVPQRPREVVQPEDKLKAGMKERIVASVVEDHERCEKAVDTRYKFEEKIKRTYFHVKPVDLKQLKNWEAYLDLEISEGDHERIVVLFERCLIPCAQYEQFWSKYAKYLESYHKETEKRVLKAKKEGKEAVPGPGEQKTILKRAKWAFGTGLGTVEDMRDKRCTWTLQGWKDKDEDGNEVMRAVDVPIKKAKMSEEEQPEEKDAEEEAEKRKEEEEKMEEENLNQIGTAEQEVEKEQSTVNNEMSSVLKTSWDGQGRQAVRDVYHRACIVHCPKRAIIKLGWAAFEEDSGEFDKAKEILAALKENYPLLLECRLQLIDLHRRQGGHEKVEEEYKVLLKKIPKNRNNIRTWVSIKLARFQFKVRGQADKALATLRVALKKERGDPRLYSQIIDVCYQRHPVDVGGVTASIELAIKSAELSHLQKLEFVKRKLEFMQEFGDVRKYRDACEQIKEYRKLCAAELKVEAKRRKELEKEEEKLKELENLKAKVRAEANMKAKMAELEGRLLCTHCQSEMYPNAGGVYEFEGFQPGVHNVPSGQRKAAPTAEIADLMAEDDDDDPDGDVVDLMDMVIPDDQEMQIKKTLEEKTKYKEVAPTWELNMESYGYGKNKKTYDPDYEHIENSRFKEYERLEGDGYDDGIKDPDHEKIKNLNAPGLGSVDPKTGRKLPGGGGGQRSKFSASDYVVQPKVPQMLVPGAANRTGKSSSSAPGASREELVDYTVFELPPEIANPTQSPCVNVPEWFVKEGGELCLSDTENGTSMLRYWPKFLSDKGNHLMFNRLRRYCKWHQKQVKIGGEWKYETRLVAWYGPCDYMYSGLHLDKNLNWAPELLDLLHRLMAMTRHDFNSCFSNLYRHGHDMCGWHSDQHPQLGRNPPVASVSLGAVRVFEFRKKNGPPNFIRFPLFPGSLLVMEGATQEDWLHCLPRDIDCKEERINLTFRTMFTLGGGS